MAWLAMEQGVDPRAMLALTFTNRAAAEMRERFAKRLQVEHVGAWLGTFHSFGLFVLRRDIDKLGRKKAFTIFDDGDQMSLMKRLVKELPAQFEKVSPREALSWVSDLKQRVESPNLEHAPADRVETSYRELWTRYHAALEQASAVDFDDLLVLAVKVLQDNEEVRGRWQRRYRYVLVDEYQDTNRAQYLLASILSEAHGNLFVVGDEDQSIYSWRGADINNILDFAEDFAGATVHRLEQNYRSTQPILDAANALVANNVNRLEKTLFTDQKEGAPVRFFHADDAEDEARFVVDDMVRRNIAPRDVAILYRTNGQSRVVEEALRTRGIHYVVFGGIRFYERKEIKDILCYLRLLVNPTDDESLRRIVNVPARGIGGVAMERFEEYAAQRRQPILEVLRECEHDDTVPLRARKAAQEFVHLIDDLALAAQSSKVAALVEKLLETTKYRSFVEQSDEKDSRSRVEIVDEFSVACATWDALDQGGLTEFLQDLSLMSDMDAMSPETPAATLLTGHSAKGLEFDHVYVLGLEEGLMPYYHEFGDARDVEEERRLCYVAMTRARQSLTLTAARSRMLYGRTSDMRDASRFLREIGRDKLVPVNREGKPMQAAAPPRAGAPKLAPRGASIAMPAKPPSAAMPVPAAADTQRLKTGTRVRHAKFGKGTVMYTAGGGDTMKVHVRFESGRFATLAIKHAPLEILEGKP
jgi:DNA helicase-2/ATP-dependent DNA helicase PcrA